MSKNPGEQFRAAMESYTEDENYKAQKRKKILEEIKKEPSVLNLLNNSEKKEEILEELRYIKNGLQEGRIDVDSVDLNHVSALIKKTKKIEK